MNKLRWKFCVILWLAKLASFCAPLPIAKFTWNHLRNKSPEQVVGSLVSSPARIELPELKSDDLSVCKFLIANPKPFLEDTVLSRRFGVDINERLAGEGCTSSELSALLPVLYLADINEVYGSLGFKLNEPTKDNVGSLYPYLSALSPRPLYSGGRSNQGSALTMIHSIPGFPENRPFKTLPDKSMRLFYSPDVAMANELCLTLDAKPTDFKFFQWATTWLPGELQSECIRNIWFQVDATTEEFFSDDLSSMWLRLANRLFI